MAQGPFPGPHPGARLEEAFTQFHESLSRCGSVFQWPNCPQMEGQGPAYGRERNIMHTQRLTHKDVIQNFNIWRILACLVQIAKFAIFCFSRFHSGARDTCVSVFVWRSLVCSCTAAVGPHCCSRLDSLSVRSGLCPLSLFLVLTLMVKVSMHKLSMEGVEFAAFCWISGSVIDYGCESL